MSYSDECMPKRPFYGGLKQANAPMNIKKKCYKDTPKVSLKCCDISPDTWKEAAQVCDTWHSLINTGVGLYEVCRANEAIQRCMQPNRRARNTFMSNLPQTIQCPQCNSVWGIDWTNQPCLHPQHYSLPGIWNCGHLWHQRMTITWYL